MFFDAVRVDELLDWSRQFFDPELDEDGHEVVDETGLGA